MQSCDLPVGRGGQVVGAGVGQDAAKNDTNARKALLRLRHQTVASVTGDIEALRFNTAIARLMEMANGLTVAAVIERPAQRQPSSLARADRSHHRR